MSRLASRLAAVAAVGLMTVPLMAAPQRGGFQRSGPVYGNVAYNGKFTFSRVRYGGMSWGGSNAWNHDYPQADMHLPLILDAITALKPNLNQSNIFTLEDPEIFRHPILYMWEPGGWAMSDAAAANLRAFLHKGGFIIFDDFEDDHWYNFEAQFRRAIPDARFFKLDTTHPLFHSFFDMNEVRVPHPTQGVVPAYFAVYKNNDPRERMIALVNYNSDVAEYWEWSGSGRLPVDTTNDAYKLGINYMIYAFLH